MSEAAPVPEDLLRHAEFVRRLARSLLSDPHAAEDLVQDTWQASLEHPPRQGGDARGWLARVARNFARRRWRAQERRLARESEVARPEALPPAESALEREEMLQRVVQAVRALPEPYRATILARFYEGLSPRDLATREGLSVETVHTRLKRGLASLRRSLERDERAWRPALALLAGGSLSLPRRGASLVVHPVMIIKTASVAATVLVLAWGTWHALSAKGQFEPVRAEPPSLAHNAGDATSASMHSTEPLGLRESVPIASAREVRISGRVVDEAGDPVPEARVVVLAAEDPFGGEEASPDRVFWDSIGGRGLVGRSLPCDAQGRWSALLVEERDVRVALQPSETFAPVEDPEVERWVHAPGEDVDFTVRRLPFATLEVRVLEGGTREPLQGFSVAIHGGRSLRPDGGSVYDAGYRSRGTTAGLVTLDLSVLEPAGRRVYVELLEPWFGRPAGAASPSQPRAELVLLPGETREVCLLLPERGRIRGFVVDAQGAPVENALVFVGDEVRARGDEPFKPLRPDRIRDGVRTAADGWFDLAGDGPRVTALHEDFSPATVDVGQASRIVVAGRGAIRGLLRTAAGLPAANRVLRLDQRDRGPETTTDDAGRFAFEQVEAGAHALWTTDEGMREPFACVRLAAGEEAELELAQEDGARGAVTLVLGPDAGDAEELGAVLIGRDRLFDVRFAFSPGGEPGTLSLPAPRAGTYWLATQVGVVGAIELAEGAVRVELERGTAELRVRATPESEVRSVQVVPADADPFLRLMAARTRVRLDRETPARFRLAPGSWLIVGEAGYVLRAVELPEEGLELVLD